MQPEWCPRAHEFLPDGALARGIARRSIAAIVTSWLGLVLGDAMRKVRR